MKTVTGISIFIILFTLFSCAGNKTIKIGFSSSMSGKFSHFGINGRDGAIIAVEEINNAGGINGRHIELLFNDDMNDPKVAYCGDMKLISEGVVAIIGHMTSSMTMASIDLINEKKLLMISPSTSTNLLNDIDDYFIRVVSTTSVETRDMAKWAYNRFNLKKISYIQDTANADYTSSWLKWFLKNYSSLGGLSGKVITYDSRENNISYSNLAQEVLDDSPEGVVIIADAQDSALLCQQIRKVSGDVPIILCAWAQTNDFIIYSGEAAEGVYFSHQFFPSPDNVKFQNFSKRFYERFKMKPEYPAVYSYDCANVIFDALKKNSDIAQLKETILKTEKYEGVSGDFVINKYGDSIREFKLLTVQNGVYAEIK